VANSPRARGLLGKQNLTCENCGQAFEVSIAKARTGRFCRITCWYAWNKAQNNKKCLTCSVEFHASKLTRERHCSVACAAKQWTLPRTAKRPRKIPGATWIEATRQKFFLVDDADVALVSDRPWSYNSKTGEFIHGRKDGTPRSVHRFLLRPPNGVFVDHASGDRSDNRRSNLRPCSHQENSRNSLKKRAGSASSRFKGVHYLPPYQRRKTPAWCAMIQGADRTRYIGTFPTEEEAARAYDAEARRSYGTFACLNFPRRGERSALGSTAR